MWSWGVKVSWAWSWIFPVLLWRCFPGSCLFDLPVFGGFGGFVWAMLEGILRFVIRVLSGVVIFGYFGWCKVDDGFDN